MARVLLTCALLSVMTAGCGLLENRSETNVTDNPSQELKQLAELTGLTFPAETKLLGARRESGLDGAYFVKLEISPAQWKSVLSSSPLAQAMFSDENRYLLGPDDGWWDPKKPKSLPTAQTPLQKGGVLNAGIDEGNTSALIVYVFWHET